MPLIFPPVSTKCWTILFLELFLEDSVRFEHYCWDTWVSSRKFQRTKMILDIVYVNWKEKHVKKYPIFWGNVQNYQVHGTELHLEICPVFHSQRKAGGAGCKRSLPVLYKCYHFHFLVHALYVLGGQLNDWMSLKPPNHLYLSKLMQRFDKSCWAMNTIRFVT